MALALRITGDPNDTITMGRRALDLAVALGDCALQAQASLNLGIVYDGIGDFGRAAELLRRHLEAANRQSGTPSTDVRILAQSQAHLARTLGALGGFAEGRRYAEEALRLTKRAGRGLTPIMAHGCLGHLSLAQVDLGMPSYCDQGLALSRASDNRNMSPMIVASLGYAYTLQGRDAEGRALLEEAISESISTDARRAVRWA
jgi:tetratricopeptide (TPR) repeat protein